MYGKILLLYYEIKTEITLVFNLKNNYNDILK